MSARLVRFVVLNYTGNPCMRLELIGCKPGIVERIMYYLYNNADKFSVGLVNLVRLELIECTSGIVEMMTV